MTTPITLESLYSLLSGFIQRQEVFNAKQEAFNSEQQGFNSRQEAFNSKQEAFNSKQESFNSTQLGFNARIEDKLDRYQEESRSNHYLSHKMILQAFEYISDIRRDIDERTEPWRKK